MKTKNDVRPRVFIGHRFGAGDVVASHVLWWSWLVASEPRVCFVPSPYTFGLIGLEDPAEARARIERDAASCAGVVLVGGGVTAEMTIAIDVVHRTGGWLSNLTTLGALPPASLRPGCLAEFRHRSSVDPGAELEFAPIVAGGANPRGGVVDLVAWLGRDCSRIARERRG